MLYVIEPVKHVNHHGTATNVTHALTVAFERGKRKPGYFPVA